MAHESINYDTAMQSSKSFAKGSPFGANASRLADGTKVNITIEGFTQNALPSGETALYANGTSAVAGSLRFRVQDPETQLPKLTIGSVVQVIKGSMEVEDLDRETRQPKLNPDGTKVMRNQAFTSFLQIVSTNTAAPKPVQAIETPAETK